MTPQLATRLATWGTQVELNERAIEIEQIKNKRQNIIIFSNE